MNYPHELTVSLVNILGMICFVQIRYGRRGKKRSSCAVVALVVGSQDGEMKERERSNKTILQAINNAAPRSKTTVAAAGAGMVFP